MIGKLSCLVASTLAVYPTGPTDYGWNGGCMTLPADRWSTGVVSQWRNANRPNSKSWHGEQMKIYLDMHDEVLIAICLTNLFYSFKLNFSVMRAQRNMMISHMLMTLISNLFLM